MRQPESESRPGVVPDFSRNLRCCPIFALEIRALTWLLGRLGPPTSPAERGFFASVEVAKFRSGECLTNDIHVITVVYPPQ